MHIWNPQIFPIKKGGCFEKGVSLNNLFNCYLSLSVWCVCVCVCVCVVYLHHFYQYYLCFTGRMIMMNCFCDIFDQQKVFSLMSSRNQCQRSSPLWISGMLQVVFKPVPNLSLGFAVVMKCSSDFCYTMALLEPLPIASNQQTFMTFTSE